MTVEGGGTSDPFIDPAIQSTSSDMTDSGNPTTLLVGRDASLTLGTDSLIVLDEALARQRKPICCGLLLGRRSLPTRSIPFFNILWAELSEFEISIRYAQQVSSSVVRRAVINYHVEKSSRTAAAAWIDALMSRAYGKSQRQKRIKVLINPYGGKGSAQKWYLRDIEPIFTAAHCQLDVERTQYSGHAIEIAENLDIGAYDVVAACSGDGVPHEIFNGLGKRKDATRALNKVAVAQLPCGTGNAMCCNLNGTNSPSLAALAVVKGLRTPMDLVSITQGEKRYLSFLSQSHGIVAETDLGTENLRWMGDLRFYWGILVRLLGKTVYPCEVALKIVDENKAAIRERHRSINNQEHSTSVSRTAGDISSLSNSSQDSLNRFSSQQGLPPLRYGTVQDPVPTDWTQQSYPTIGNFYAGNMAFMSADLNFFPAALPSDGCLDLVCIDGALARTKAVNCLLAVGDGKFFDLPYIDYRKLAAYRIIPQDRYEQRGWRWVGWQRGVDRAGRREKKQGFISIDGERVPFEPFQAEVHPALGTVLSRSAIRYEVPKFV